jgi:hypothetical protein
MRVSVTEWVMVGAKAPPGIPFPIACACEALNPAADLPETFIHKASVSRLGGTFRVAKAMQATLLRRPS